MTKNSKSSENRSCFVLKKGRLFGHVFHDSLFIFIVNIKLILKQLFEGSPTNESETSSKPALNSVVCHLLFRDALCCVICCVLSYGLCVE